jgi:hypothetical protein
MTSNVDNSNSKENVLKRVYPYLASNSAGSVIMFTRNEDGEIRGIVLFVGTTTGLREDLSIGDIIEDVVDIKQAQNDCKCLDPGIRIILNN